MRPARAILFNDTRVDLHHGCAAVVGAIDDLCQKNGIEIVHRVPAHTDWRKSASVAECLMNVDLALVNGEGTIHHDRPAARILMEVGRTAAQYGVKSALINFGWEENGDELHSMLGDFTLLASRDESAARGVRKRGIPCLHVPDLSLVTPCELGNLEGRDGVGFTDSVLRNVALELAAACSERGGRPVPIRFADEGMRASLRFFARSVPKAEARNPIRLARIVQYRIRELLLQTPDTGAFLNQLASLKVVVSGRFHACTLCIASGTPFVAVGSNTSKIERLIEEVGLDPLRCAPTVQDAVSRVAALQYWSTEEQRSIKAYRETAKAKAEELFREIRGLVRESRDRPDDAWGEK